MTERDAYAAIWDVDGTLVDTAELHFQAWLELCRQIGRPFSRVDFAATFGRRNPEIIRQLFGAKYGDAEIAELGYRKEELYRAEAAKGVELLPGVRSLLEGLRDHGFKQAIGSSAPRHNLELILRLTRAEPFFQTIVAMEDTQRGKPDPEVFLVAAQRLGVEPGRCVVLEDAVAGVEAAKAGGMKCIAVRFVGHHPEAALRQAGAELVVPNLEAVSAQSVRELFCGEGG
jgi:beta-phosphoglucomutase